MATFGTDFDEYAAGEVGSVTSSAFSTQSIPSANWEHTIVDLGGGDMAARIDRPSGSDSGISIIAYNPLETAGDIDVVASWTYGALWQANYFAGPVLAHADNRAYAVRRSDNGGTEAFRFGIVNNTTGSSSGTIGTYYDMPIPAPGVVIWQRIRRVGTTLMGKIWTGAAGDEPGTWAWSGTEATLETVKPALYGFRAGMRPYDYLWFGVGTGGDAAPTSGGGTAPTAKIVQMLLAA